MSGAALFVKKSVSFMWDIMYVYVLQQLSSFFQHSCFLIIDLLEAYKVREHQLLVFINFEYLTWDKNRQAWARLGKQYVIKGK